jgi:hypothetical protein
MGKVSNLKRVAWIATRRKPVTRVRNKLDYTAQVIIFLASKS